jgi:hypothetical protein
VLSHCAINLVLGAGDLLLALVHLIDGLLKLGFQLGNFEYGEHLALLDDVTDIDINLSHVPADFGMNIDHLVRLELTRERQYVADVTALRNGDARCGDGRSPGFARVIITRATCAEVNDHDGYGANCAAGFQYPKNCSCGFRMHCQTSSDFAFC